MKRRETYYPGFFLTTLHSSRNLLSICSLVLAITACNTAPAPKRDADARREGKLDRSLFLRDREWESQLPAPAEASHDDKVGGSEKPRPSTVVEKKEKDKENKPAEVPLRSFTLEWDAPTKKEDGSPLTDLAGYKVYLGTASRKYTKVETVGNFTKYTFEPLPAKVYYVAATAYDKQGNESRFSKELVVDLLEK